MQRGACVILFKPCSSLTVDEPCFRCVPFSPSCRDQAFVYLSRRGVSSPYRRYGAYRWPSVELCVGKSGRDRLVSEHRARPADDNLRTWANRIYALVTLLSSEGKNRRERHTHRAKKRKRASNTECMRKRRSI